MSAGAAAALAAAALLAGCVPAAAQSQPPIGVAECDRYVSMTSACLPKMCEDERALAELELAFARETLLKVIELKGRAAAATSCAEDIRRAVEADVYGCHEPPAGKAAPLRLDHVRPGPTSVAMQFTLAGATNVEVLIGEALENPAHRYRVAGTHGRFVLDTASAAPAASGGRPEPPAALEPGTTYCYAIQAPAGEGNSTPVRKGTFTTTAKRGM